MVKLINLEKIYSKIQMLTSRQSTFKSLKININWYFIFAEFTLNILKT